MYSTSFRRGYLFVLLSMGLLGPWAMREGEASEVVRGHWAVGPMPQPLATIRMQGTFKNGYASADWFRHGSQWQEVDRWGRWVGRSILEDDPAIGNGVKDVWWAPQRLRRLDGRKGAQVYVAIDEHVPAPGMPWAPSAAEREGFLRLLDPGQTEEDEPVFFRPASDAAGCGAAGGTRLVLACLDKHKVWRLSFRGTSRCFTVIEAKERGAAREYPQRLPANERHRLTAARQWCRMEVRAVLDMDGDGRAEVIAADRAGGTAQVFSLRTRLSRYRVVAHSIDDGP